LDEHSNICSGNPDLVLDTDENVSRQFAEFHFHDSNKKDTAMISATNDPICAVTRANHQLKETREMVITQFIWSSHPVRIPWALNLRMFLTLST
jgi:hypothetical protein